MVNHKKMKSKRNNTIASPKYVEKIQIDFMIKLEKGEESDSSPNRKKSDHYFE